MFFGNPSPYGMGMRPKRPSFALVILYAVFGLYFLNFPQKFVPIPAMILPLEKWIIFVGGILLVVAFVGQLQRATRGF